MTIDEIHVLSADYDRISEAYLALRDVGYRPVAPHDGLGSLDLTARQIHYQPILKANAIAFTKRFFQEEASLHFYIGRSKYETNRALVFTIEAARLLCRGNADRLAVRLLGMAIADVKKESSAFRT